MYYKKIQPSWEPPEKKPYQRPQAIKPLPRQKALRSPPTKRRINVNLKPSLAAHRQFLSFIRSLKDPMISPESKECEETKPKAIYQPLSLNKKNWQPFQERINQLDTNKKETINQKNSCSEGNKNEIHIYLPRPSPIHQTPELS